MAELTQEDLGKIFSGRVALSPADAGAKIRLEVSSVHVNTGENKEQSPMIVNLKAYSGYHLDRAKELAAEGDMQGAANQNLSKGIRLTDFVPSKGDVVDCIIETYTNSEGIEDCVGISRIIEVKSETRAKAQVSFAALGAKAAKAELKA